MHTSVLLRESVDRLIEDESGVYFDLTYGAGGHSKLILSQLSEKGRLFGMDRDDRVGVYTLDDDRFQLIHGNFKYLDRVVEYLGLSEVDGILADLGVSSMQLDQAEYGMAYRFDNVLDMRMNRRQSWSAADVINDYDERALMLMFSKYGELPNPKQLANAVVSARKIKRISRSLEFVDVISGVIRGDRLRYLSQVFQAVRMEVNDELGSIERMLTSAKKVLKPGGVLSIITFHSLEDRYVKNMMKYGNIEGLRIKDEYGNLLTPFKVITKKPIEATKEERFQNKRARSAKLRIAVKK